MGTYDDKFCEEVHEAVQDPGPDRFNALDWSGGNYDDAFGIGVAYGGWLERKKQPDPSAARIAELEARVRELEGALDALHSAQNGAPLEKYRAAWETAMLATEKALQPYWDRTLTPK